MSQRSILAKPNETIIIKAGGSAMVKGDENNLVRVETKDKWGLTVERQSGSQIGWTRAATGNQALFDILPKLPKPSDKNKPDDVIIIQLGGSGVVIVPYLSDLKIYAGKNIEVQGVSGQVDAYSGWNLELKDVHCLGNASAGRTMNIDCQTMIGEDVTFGAGSDLRFHVTDLTDVRLRVKDLGGYWEARIGKGGKSVYLKSGGDVTFVTDQQVEPLPPNYVLGKIKPPSQS